MHEITGGSSLCRNLTRLTGTKTREGQGVPNGLKRAQPFPKHACPGVREWKRKWTCVLQKYCKLKEQAVTISNGKHFLTSDRSQPSTYQPSEGYLQQQLLVEDRFVLAFLVFFESCCCWIITRNEAQPDKEQWFVSSQNRKHWIVCLFNSSILIRTGTSRKWTRNFLSGREPILAQDA